MACSSVAGDRAVIHAIDIVTYLPWLEALCESCTVPQDCVGTYNLSACLAGSMRSYRE